MAPACQLVAGLTSGRSSLIAPTMPIASNPSMIERSLAQRSLDHDDFGSNRSKIMNVIDSNILERDAGGKPLHTFPHPALEANA
jgi:hypothetical protein